MIVSDLCADLWRPLETTPETAVARITPTPLERKAGVTAAHLVDDFALAQNIARFGLRFKSFEEICKERGFEGVEIWPESAKPGEHYRTEYFYHEYLLTMEQKAKAIETRIKEWRIEHVLEQFREDL